jgi:hypothetical protein
MLTNDLNGKKIIICEEIDLPGTYVGPVILAMRPEFYAPDLYVYFDPAKAKKDYLFDRQEFNEGVLHVLISGKVLPDIPEGGIPYHMYRAESGMQREDCCVYECIYLKEGTKLGKVNWTRLIAIRNGCKDLNVDDMKKDLRRLESSAREAGDDLRRWRGLANKCLDGNCEKNNQLALDLARERLLSLPKEALVELIFEDTGNYVQGETRLRTHYLFGLRGKPLSFLKKIVNETIKNKKAEISERIGDLA